MPEAEPEVDYPAYLNKPPTDLQERFPDFIIDKVGYDPQSAKTKDEAFRQGVRLAVALRMSFQASPENREATQARRQERAAQAEVVQEETAAPTKRAAKKAAAAPPPPAPAPAKRGGRRAKATTSTASAPF